MRILWRTTVFLVTLLLIYLAFPILIVPSSLPAIQAILVEATPPSTQTALTQADDPDAVPIQQLQLPVKLTGSEKIQELKKLHQQGLDLITQAFK